MADTTSTEKDKDTEIMTDEGRVMEGAEKSPSEEQEQLVAAPTTDELLSLIKELEEKVEQYKDQWLRALAEYQNFRKRVISERGEFFEEGKKQVITEVLPVLDNLERSLRAMDDFDSEETSNSAHSAVRGNRVEALKNGVELVRKQFVDCLAKLDVVPISAEGEKFDPMLHEPVERVVTTEVEEGTVIEEVQRGYRMGQRVLRPARVKVAVRPMLAVQTEQIEELDSPSS